MTNTEKPQPMEVDQKDQKKPEEKAAAADDKPELVEIFFCQVIFKKFRNFPLFSIYFVLKVIYAYIL